MDPRIAAAVFPPGGTKDNDVTRCCKLTIAKDKTGRGKGRWRRERQTGRWRRWNLPEGNQKLHSVASRLQEGRIKEKMVYESRL